jgi:hypothetical protein
MELNLNGCKGSRRLYAWVMANIVSWIVVSYFRSSDYFSDA